MKVTTIPIIDNPWKNFPSLLSFEQFFSNENRLQQFEHRHVNRREKDSSFYEEEEEEGYFADEKKIKMGLKLM